MDTYKGHLWCELQLPTILIVEVIACFVFLTFARFAHTGAQWAQ